MVSHLPWNESVQGAVRSGAGRIFFRHEPSNCVAARCWFDEAMADRLKNCYRRDTDRTTRIGHVQEFRYACRVLSSTEEEEELGFHGRRVRGEIFFARRWILVEGVTEYLLLHALGKALDWPLDTHGVAVIDFQQSGNAGIYPALAEGFGIPWHMIVDGDQEAAKFRQQILDRGFGEDALANHVSTLTASNDLEDQLLADGNEPLLREILAEVGSTSALDCPAEEFRARLKNKKTGYMGALSLRIAKDQALARHMPEPFVSLITELRDSAA